MKGFLVKAGVVFFLFLLTFLIGRYLFPFIAYSFSFYLDIVTFFLSGLIFSILLLCYAKTKCKDIVLYGIIIMSSLILVTVTGYKRYGHNSIYIGDFIGIYSDTNIPNNWGLADKFGCTFIEPKYDFIVKVFEDKTSSYIYIGIKSNLIEGDSLVGDKNIEFYSHDLCLFDKDGVLQKILSVDKGDCNYINDYIEKHIGKITEQYWGGQNYSRMIKDISELSTDNWDSNNEIEGGVSELESTNDQYNKGIRQSEKNNMREKKQVWKERWKPCISCDSGKCRECHGQGGFYIGDIYNLCGSCGGSRICRWCNGRGEVLETYSTWE